MKPEHIKRFEEDFKTHVAKFAQYTDEQCRTIERLEWRRADGSSIDYINYLLLGGTLFVSGDHGEATFCWGQNLTWEWVAGFDEQYFNGKCRASDKCDGHRAGREWYPEKAYKDMLTYFGYSIKGFEEVSKPTRTKRLNEYMVKHFGRVLKEDDECFRNMYELYRLIEDADLTEGYSENVDCGFDIPYHHLVIIHGLRMAVQQRKEAETMAALQVPAHLLGGEVVA
jgi:hypothetical protein